MRDAEELKAEGNDHFREKRWDEAICAYRSALGHLPKRREPRRKVDEKGLKKEKGKERQVEAEPSAGAISDEDDDDDDHDGSIPTARSGSANPTADAYASGDNRNRSMQEKSPCAEDSEDNDKAPEDPHPPSEMEVQCTKLRAALHANIGACFVKLVSALLRSFSDLTILVAVIVAFLFHFTPTPPRFPPRITFIDLSCAAHPFLEPVHNGPYLDNHISVP